MAIDIDSILSEAQAHKGLPPVHLWSPDLSGVIDIAIKADGSWWHEGDKIQREKLAQLFASILKREGDDYFLVTPVEKWQLSVEDLPFFISVLHVEAEGTNEQVISLISALGDVIVVGENSELDLDASNDEPKPSVKVRDNLYARISRNVYYQLLDLAEEKTIGETNVLSLLSQSEQLEVARY